MLSRALCATMISSHYSSILHIELYICQSQSPNSPLPSLAGSPVCSLYRTSVSCQHLLVQPGTDCQKGTKVRVPHSPSMMERQTRLGVAGHDWPLFLCGVCVKAVLNGEDAVYASSSLGLCARCLESVRKCQKPNHWNDLQAPVVERGSSGPTRLDSLPSCSTSNQLETQISFHFAYQNMPEISHCS